MNNKKALLVTSGGECFEADFQREERAQQRDGVCYLFHLKDLVKEREKLSLLNRLEDSTNIGALRNELQTIWGSAMPLS